MIFPRGQTLTFHGRTASTRARSLVADAGEDAVEIAGQGAEKATVRLKREFRLLSDAALRTHIQREAALMASAK